MTLPRDDDGFRAGLAELLREAYRDGTTLRGSWEVRNGRDTPDYDVEISRITKPPEDRADRGGRR